MHTWQNSIIFKKTLMRWSIFTKSNTHRVDVTSLSNTVNGLKWEQKRLYFYQVFAVVTHEKWNYFLKSKRCLFEKIPKKYTFLFVNIHLNLIYMKYLKLRKIFTDTWNTLLKTCCSVQVSMLMIILNLHFNHLHLLAR